MLLALNVALRRDTVGHLEAGGECSLQSSRFGLNGAQNRVEDNVAALRHRLRAGAPAMKITNSKPVTEIERTAASESAPQQQRVGRRADRVSVGETRSAVELSQSAKQAVQEDRDVRLKRLEAAVKEGSYKPMASKVAEEMLTQAELDSKLRTLLKP